MTNNDTNETFSQQQPNFVRVADAAFWEDRDRVKALTDLYEQYSYLLDFQLPKYKNVTKKAKERSGTHFGVSGIMHHYITYMYMHIVK